MANANLDLNSDPLSTPGAHGAPADFSANELFFPEAKLRANQRACQWDKCKVCLARMQLVA
jgi:hypothetical protein